MLLQSSHAYEYEFGPFDYDPSLVVNVFPSIADPLTDGDTRICGGMSKGERACGDGVPLT